MSVDVLQNKIRKLKNPSMVGLDPTPDIIPSFILQEAFAEKGHTLNGLAEAYNRFCTGILNTLAGYVPAVKVQSACFEALGADGIRVMQELLALAQRLGYYVLLDSMRGDVGNIAGIHADAVFGETAIGENTFRPYVCDAVTVNGYLGSDGIKPFLPYLQDGNGKNIFLLIKTSNKSSSEVQDLISGDRLIHTAMADLAMRWSTGLFGKYGYSEIIAVVGGTNTRVLTQLRGKYDRLFFMVPGFGAQGGTPRSVKPAFDRFGHGAVVSASRSIISAWKNDPEKDEREYLTAIRAAAVKMRDDICNLVTVM